jgi:hypothetical protein
LGSVSPELCDFAEGLRADHDAVRAALCEEWSNGQVEGQINRLKLLKRQMYDRAGFTLLKERVLYAAEKPAAQGSQRGPFLYHQDLGRTNVEHRTNPGE